MFAAGLYPQAVGSVHPQIVAPTLKGQSISSSPRFAFHRFIPFQLMRELVWYCVFVLRVHTSQSAVHGSLRVDIHALAQWNDVLATHSLFHSLTIFLVLCCALYNPIPIYLHRHLMGKALYLLMEGTEKKSFTQTTTTENEYPVSQPVSFFFRDTQLKK